MTKQIIQKYCEVLDIKDFDKKTPEEEERWQKLLKLTPTARGYVCIAKNQGIDILDCYSKESLYKRYNSHVNLTELANYLKINPKKVLLKGNLALYFTEQDVQMLDKFINTTPKKDIKKIIFEQNCLKKYGVKSFKELNSYKEKLSKCIKDNWQQDGYRKNISDKVKSSWQNKSEEEKINKQNSIKEALSKLPEEKRNHWKTFSREKKDLICERIAEGRRKYYSKVVKDNTINFIVDGHCCSHKEKEVENFIKGLGFEVQSNVRNLIKTKDGKVKELDIYIPEKKLAIEFDGVYWHSSKFSYPTFHLEKTELCDELGVRLIHILDFHWNTKQDICKNIIKAALGKLEIKIPARKCQIREIDSETYKDFLTKYHIQGAVNSKIRYGLFFEVPLN